MTIRLCAIVCHGVCWRWAIERSVLLCLVPVSSPCLPAPTPLSPLASTYFPDGSEVFPNVSTHFNSLQIYSWTVWSSHTVTTMLLQISNISSDCGGSHIEHLLFHMATHQLQPPQLLQVVSTLKSVDEAMGRSWKFASSIILTWYGWNIHAMGLQ